MGLEVMELTAEEANLIECYRAMTLTDRQLCLFLAVRFSTTSATTNIIPNIIFKSNKNKSIILNVGDNSNNNSLINQPPQSSED